MQIDPKTFAGWTSEASALMRKFVSDIAPERTQLLDGLRVKSIRGASYYSPITRTAAIGSGSVEAMPADRARRETIETTLHESTHHLLREAGGFPGPLAFGQPGRVTEGVAQAVAGAAMALHGETADDRAWGVRVLDPSWQTVPVGEFRKRPVPLSLTMDDIGDGRIRFWEDSGHVHGGIITNAHRQMAANIGMREMAAVTLEAMDAAHALVSMRGWADATVAAAAQLHGHGSAQVQGVRDAWRAVKLDPGA